MVIRAVTVSDLSGEEGAATVRIGFDGYRGEVDLTETERDVLEEQLRPYALAGRRIAEPTRRTVLRTTAEERVRIRAWADANGYVVASRGTIPTGVYAAYKDAHPDEPRSPRFTARSAPLEGEGSACATEDRDTFVLRGGNETE